MAALTAQTIARAGVVPTYNAAGAGGDTFANTGNEFVLIKNGDSGTHVVTIAIPALVDGFAVTSRTVSIVAGAQKAIGPFPKGTYNDSGGLVHLTYDGVTSVTIAVLKPGN